jgi:hypothetical protein
MIVRMHPLGTPLNDLVGDRAWVNGCAENLIRLSRQSSAKRGLPHAITSNFIIKLIESQNFRCAVSAIEFTPSRLPGAAKRQPFAPSIDRIDNSRGYESDNVRLVCLIVNLARSNFDDVALVTMAGAITGRNP